MWLFFPLSYALGFVTQLLCYANKRICQYDERVHRKEQLATRINMIPYKNIDFIHIYFCKATDLMQNRPLKAYKYRTFLTQTSSITIMPEQ